MPHELFLVIFESLAGCQFFLLEEDEWDPLKKFNGMFIGAFPSNESGEALEKEMSDLLWEQDGTPKLLKDDKNVGPAQLLEQVIKGTIYIGQV